MDDVIRKWRLRSGWFPDESLTNGTISVKAEKITIVSAVLILAVLALAMLANSTTKALGRDEQMYCTAGILLANGHHIYKDFSYVAQMPYHPLLYAGLYKILGTTQYLLTGRIVSVVCDILVMVLIVIIYRRAFGKFSATGTLFGLAGAILYVFNPIVDYANGYAWNNDVVSLCIVASFWLFVSTDFRHKVKYWRIGLIAALLTFATFMRITTALVILAFLVGFFIQLDVPAKRKFGIIAVFLCVSAVVSSWPIYMITKAPKAFLLNAVNIQTLNSQWLQKIGLFFSKPRLLYQCLTAPGYLSLILLGAYLWLTVVLLRRRQSTENSKAMLLSGLLVLLFFIIALSLPTMWRQHLAAPVPFIIINLAYPAAFLRRLADTEGYRKYFNRVSLSMAGCAAIAVTAYPVVLDRIPQVFTVQNWVPVRLHKVSEDIADKAGKDRPVLTLAPLWALEGGCKIYNELSAGPFVYRIADFMTHTEREVTSTVAPSTIAELIEKSPPAAVILGTEPKFIEKSLFNTLTRLDCKEHLYDEAGVQVYLVP